MPKFLRHLRLNRRLLACVMACTASTGTMAATTTLSDTPVYSTSNVPANLMLALSVEYPTGTVAAYKDSNGYASSTVYLGYFDAAKCYDYDSSDGYFVPLDPTATPGPVCTGHWSGNMLNWALMTSLDEFRQALTGGNRSVDTSSVTVLERSNLNTDQSELKNFPDKIVSKSNPVRTLPSTVIGDSNYSSLNTVYLRSYKQGTTFVISNNSSFTNDNNGNRTTTYNAQVQVCVSGMQEGNCNSQHQDYVGAGKYDKPEGLIQQNYTKIRVGASGYAFLKGDAQPNGAVRALLRDNGPTKYNGYGARPDNAYSEWNATTGVFNPNPDSADSTYATAPGGVAFTDSGAINYLNKFGYEGDYEQYDTVSDLYWATLAYYMQVPLDTSYTSGLTKDNSTDPTFPVFIGTKVASSSNPTMNDPIQYTCQNNAIVTIGDAHTWLDTRVPTSAPASGNGNSSGAPLSPLTVGGTVGTALDASGYVTKLGNLPLIEAHGSTAASQTMAQYLGVTSLGSTYEIGSREWATYNMAGLAYYAHINDIRADIGGSQKITTYTVDVLEPGTYDGSSSHPTYNPSGLGNGSGPDMYWLAAKYGGFNDVNGDGIPANMLTWHTNNTTEADGNLRPDNYFPGNQASLIQNGLKQIFNNVASTSSQSGSGLTVNTSHGLTNVTANAAPYYAPVAGFPAYTSQYTPVTWTGDVAGFIATTATGSAVSAATGSTPWHAQLQLDTLTQATSSNGTMGWDTGRRIITWNGSKGVPFRYDSQSLSTAEMTALDATGHGADFVNYLRGDKSKESKEFRARTHILGDIVDSAAVLVQGALSTSYSESANPGYTAFTKTVASREPVVYVGANDGMLHAFEADFQSATTANPVTGGGSELFAYIPSMLFNGPNGTPLVDGLPALGNLDGVSANAFAHHFYVDASPQVADVDFTYISDGNSNPTTTAATADWHTILVGGLGKGGKGIYALDITSVPSAVDTTSSSTVETTQAGKVLWEFTEADMGYSFGAPLIIKTRKYGWVVAVTSGYGNTGGSLAGHGILYILNAKTGKMLQKIDTGAGNTNKPAGLAQATAFTQDVTDGTVDQIYAGDLLGNVWRFDLTENAVDSGIVTGNYPVTLFATLKDSSKNAQPITTAPRVEESLSSDGLSTLRWVFVGTGKFLDITDLTDTQKQTMYALRDGSGSTPATTGLPLTRDSLTSLTNLTTGITTLTDSSSGWYYDLTNSAGGTSGGTERIVVAPAAVTGLNIVAWTTVIPSSDPCSLQGALYVTNYAGESVLLSDGAQVTYLTTAAAPTGVQLLQNSDGSVTVASSTSAGVTTFKAVNQKGNGNQINRVNWREILH